MVTGPRRHRAATARRTSSDARRRPGHHPIFQPQQNRVAPGPRSIDTGSLRELLGYVVVDADGIKKFAKGENSEQLGDFLHYLHTLANLIGRIFDLDPAVACQIENNAMTAVAMKKDSETLGIILDKSIRPEEFFAKYSVRLKS